MAKACLLRNFLCCGSLRTGTLVAAISGIILAITAIIVILTVNIALKTIVLDWLDPFIIKIIVIINLVMTVFICILLIIGTFKRNMYLMLPWVALGALLPIGLLVSVIITSISFFNKDDTFNGSLWLVIGLLSFVVYCYMWLVVFSFFYTIRQEAARGAYTKDPFRRQPT